MRPYSTKPEEVLNEAQLLLTQFVVGKMHEVPKTREGVEMLRNQNVPMIPAYWLANDWLYEPYDFAGSTGEQGEIK